RRVKDLPGTAWPVSSSASARPSARPSRIPSDARRHNPPPTFVPMVAAVNHEDCIAILLSPPSGPPDDPETTANRGTAEEHAAWCSDCWSVLRTAYELATGEAPAESDRMQSLFGCDAVQDRLYLLTDLTAADIRNREPVLARHLGWCIACRERLVELIALGRAAAPRELEPRVAPPA